MNKKNKNVKTPRACGTWPSPITPDLLSGKIPSYSALSGRDGKLFWLERRFDCDGRVVLMSFDPQKGVYLFFDEEVNIGTKVHGYGGGGYALSKNHVAFVQKKSNEVRLSRNGEASHLIGFDPKACFAGLVFDQERPTLFAVREKFNEDKDRQPQNSLVVLGKAFPKEGKILCEGADFYMFPTPSPDGQYLSWVEWNHPYMPWDGTRLCIGRLIRHADDTIEKIADRRVVADGMVGEKSVSYLQPCWNEQGELFVLCDKQGYWGIWQAGFGTKTQKLQPFFVPKETEIGQPPWVFGQVSYRMLEGGQCIAVLTHRGEDRIYVRDPSGTIKRFYARTRQCPVPLGGGQFGWLEVSPQAFPKIMVGNGEKEKDKNKTIRAPETQPINQDDISQPENIKFAIRQVPGLYGQAYFYPPQNAHFCPLEGEKPPMVVRVHGGPTGRSTDDFSLKIQQWTTRGIAVLDVNYGGSTGFGRDWRLRLAGQWGVVDVNDCIDATRYVITTGDVDPRRIAIRGSSSGGMSVFLALAKSPLFAGGVSAYGVTDLCGLQADTHKFEAHYNDSLVGAWPRARDTYEKRSPIHCVSAIHVPVLMLHGDSDKVVPLSQAREMAKRLKEAGVPYSLKEYAGEGHGFRGAPAIKDAFEREYAFYGRIFHFKPDPG